MKANFFNIEKVSVKSIINDKTTKLFFDHYLMFFFILGQQFKRNTSFEKTESSSKYYFTFGSFV